MIQNNDMYHLTKYDNEILEIFWKAGRSLTITEVVNSDDKLELSDVKSSIKKLLYRNLLEISGLDFTNMSRNYRPAISACDFKAKNYIEQMKVITGDDFSDSQFIAAVLEHGKGMQELKKLDELERILLNHRKHILEAEEKDK